MVVAVGGTPLIHFYNYFMPQIGSTNPNSNKNSGQDSGQGDPADAGARARANDIVDALLESKALLDSQRKAEAEADIKN